MDYNKITYEEWVAELKKGNPEASKRPPLGWYRQLSRSADADEIKPSVLIYMQDYFLSKCD